MCLYSFLGTFLEVLIWWEMGPPVIEWAGLRFMWPTKVLCCLDKSFSLVWPRAAAAKSPCCWVEINHLRGSRTTCRCNKQQPESLLKKKKHMKKNKINKYSSVLLMLFTALWQVFGFSLGCVFLVLVVFLKTEANSAGYVAFLFVRCIIALLY